MHSFYLSPEDWADEAPFVRLTGPEAKHLIRVLRAEVGDEVRIFNGQGRHALCRVDNLEKQAAILAVESETVDAPPAIRVHMALGWAKGLRRGWLLEKAVELEADSVWFWQAARSQGKVPETPKDSWEAQLIAGAKQSEAAWLPKLRTFPKGIQNVIAAAKDFDHVYILWEGRDHHRLLRTADLPLSGDILFILGPEGGFIEKELKALTDAGFPAVSLGRRVLRWETAALLCMGITWRHAQEALSSPPSTPEAQS